MSTKSKAYKAAAELVDKSRLYPSDRGHQAG